MQEMGGGPPTHRDGVGSTPTTHRIVEIYSPGGGALKKIHGQTDSCMLELTRGEAQAEMDASKKYTAPRFWALFRQKCFNFKWEVREDLLWRICFPNALVGLAETSDDF